MNRAIARPSSPIVVTAEPACHAGGRGFESRRSRRPPRVRPLAARRTTLGGSQPRRRSEPRPLRSRAAAGCGRGLLGRRAARRASRVAPVNAASSRMRSSSSAVKSAPPDLSESWRSPYLRPSSPQTAVAGQPRIGGWLSAKSPKPTQAGWASTSSCVRRTTSPGASRMPCNPYPRGSTRKSRQRAYCALRLKNLRAACPSPSRSTLRAACSAPVRARARVQARCRRSSRRAASWGHRRPRERSRCPRLRWSS